MGWRVLNKFDSDAPAWLIAKSSRPLRAPPTPPLQERCRLGVDRTFTPSGCIPAVQQPCRLLYRGDAYRQRAAQSAFTSSNSTTLVWPVMGTMTPGDFTIILLPLTRMKYTRSVSKIA
jgi:hypothetical protein